VKGGLRILLKNRLSFRVALSAFLAIFGVGGAMAWANDGSPCFDLSFPSVLGTGEGGDKEWRLQTYRGSPDLRVDRLVDQNVLRLSGCGKTAFGLKREVEVDTVRYPFLQWQWKADRLPAGGDIRLADRDDQALQLYVIFPSRGFPALFSSPTLAYIWDNEAPKNLAAASPQRQLSHVRYVVLRNKTDTLGQWYTERRNLPDDYRRLFPDLKGGEPPDRIRGVMVFLNTHHTEGCAEGSIGPLRFVSGAVNPGVR
jgi:hypothetical protein